MKFTSKNENYRSQKNKGWLKNPYVRPATITKNAENKLFKVDFCLCVTENAVERIIETNTLIFTEFDIEALIEVDGVEIPLIPHLMSGGVYDIEAVTIWGQPMYDALSQYFDEGFSPLEFKESPMKFLAVDWALNSIKIEGVLLKNFFELEAL
jgi:hypothetical protein